MDSLAKGQRPKEMTDAQWRRYCELIPEGGMHFPMETWPSDLKVSFSHETQTAGTIRAHVANWVMKEYPEKGDSP